MRRNVGEPIERLMVGPLPLTPARREAVVQTATEIRYGRFRWLESPRFEWAGWAKPRRHRVRSLDAALSDPSIRGFVGWARFPWAEIDEHPEFWEVHLMDARYTLERGARFGSVMVRVPKTDRAEALVNANQAGAQDYRRFRQLAEAEQCLEPDADRRQTIDRARLSIDHAERGVDQRAFGRRSSIDFTICPPLVATSSTTNSRRPAMSSPSASRHVP